MSKVLVSENSLYDIASAIRSKNGSSETYRPGDMAAAIVAIPTGGTGVLVSKTITQNGEYDPADDNADGYSGVAVNVTPNLQSKTATQNGMVTPDAGYDGLSSVEVNVQGGGGNLYTNVSVPDVQITDISAFTRLYSTSIPYGSYGQKVNNALGLTNETTIKTNMSAGWNGTGSCYYDSENRTGAYAGYEWATAQRLGVVKLFLGRYSGQNTNLNANVEYKDENGDWQTIETLVISTTLPYPLNEFMVFIPDVDIYGIRWIHTTPNKSSNNNIVFFGMTLYTQSTKQAYKPTGKGLIEPPAGYDGFGTLYIE